MSYFRLDNQLVLYNPVNPCHLKISQNGERFSLNRLECTSYRRYEQFGNDYSKYHSHHEIFSVRKFQIQF